MTYAYSATARGMARQVEEALNELDDERRDRGEPPHLHGYDNAKAAFWLAQQLYVVAAEMVPAARRAMDWLKSSARVMNKADLPIWWTSPAGLPVMQRYTKPIGQRVNITFRGRKMQLNLDDEAGLDSLAGWLDASGHGWVDARRALNGIAPNFVHSLDAGHLMAVVIASKARSINALAVIHDSFATHASATDALSAILRDTFVDQYEASPLEQFRRELIDQLGHDAQLQRMVPPLPPTGDLDLNAARNATYMFA
jgi:DNA-directed RNA polymerase